MGNSPRTVSIHVLDDDSLLHVFYLYRPFLLGEDQDDSARRRGGKGGWVRGRWWYRLAHVCQRWRDVILRSPSYLGLSLVCTNGTPVADMLAHSPLLPLLIDYSSREISTEDEEGIILALRQLDRVCRVRLQLPATSLQKLIVAMDEDYPILEYLIIVLPTVDRSTILVFPETFQALHLRHLRLRGFTLPIGSRLLTTAVGLVTLQLIMFQPSTYFLPNTLLQWISLMPLLETLVIFFKLPIPNRELERQLRQLRRTPITTHVTLPNLRHFQYHGVSTYLEALVHRVTTPRLEKFDIEFFNQLTFSVPCLLQFMDTADNFRFHSARFAFFDEQVEVAFYSHQPHEAEMRPLGIIVFCRDLDWQVSSSAQISNSLSQIFSAVERLTLVHKEHTRSSEEHNEFDRTEWRRFLRPFSNVKTLRINNELIRELSLCLGSEDGELPLELLPELQELTYFASDDANDAFTSFIDTRQNADRPVNLVRRSPSPSPDPSSSVPITPANEAGGDQDT